MDAFHAAHPGLTGTQKERAAIAKAFVDLDPTRFSWDRADFNRLADGLRYSPDDADYRVATYRPFVRRWLNIAREHNNTAGKASQVFPRNDTDNLTIVVSTRGARNPFTVFMTRDVPDVHPWVDDVPCLPRRIAADNAPASDRRLFGASQAVLEDNITHEALAAFRGLDEAITTDDVFFYTYGVLHAPDYRDTFAADLRRSLPRIPRVDAPEDFWRFSRAGRNLSHLHTQYEDIEVWPDLDIRFASRFDPGNPDHLRVTKMRYGTRTNPDDPRGRRVDDPTTIIYSDLVTIAGIPERAHKYRLGARSALDWVVDQQQVKTDKASGITTDPNDWGAERGDPRYLLDLVGRVVTVIHAHA